MNSAYRTEWVDEQEDHRVTGRAIFNSGRLPVSWIDFKGHCGNNKVELRWTIEETSNNRFEIERSVNGSDFVRIATVESKGNGRNNYSYSGGSFITGRNYYRIKQVDRYGITSYSKVITVKVEKKTLVSIDETIVTSQLTVTVNNDDKGILMIADGAGKNLFKTNAVNGMNHISTNALSKGIYHLIYFNGEQEVETFRFMKQ